MDDETLAFTPATKLAELIRTKQISPVEVMEATLRRIAAKGPAGLYDAAILAALRHGPLFMIALDSA